MYKVDLSYLNRKYKSAYICFLISFVLFAIFFFLFIIPKIEKNKLQGEVKASKVIVSSYIDEDKDTMYNVKYEYIVNNTTYECKSNSSYSSTQNMYEKDIIYYDVFEPSKCISQYKTEFKTESYMILVLVVVFILVGFFNLGRKYKEKRRIRKLEKNGILIKGLRYKLVDSDHMIKGVNYFYKCIQIRYEVSEGRFITLTSNPRLDSKVCDGDGLVDLLIDPTNESNYFIDFEIKQR